MCLPNLDLMEPTGVQQHKTTYLISLTLVKVETTEDPGMERARESVEGATSQAGGKQVSPNADSSNRDLKLQKQEEVAEPEARKLTQLKTEQEILPGPRDHKALFTDGAQPSDRKKSITSSTAANGGAREATGASQTSISKDAAEPTQPPTASDGVGRVNKRPVSLLKTHSGAISSREVREARDSIHASSKSLDRKDSRTRIQSPASPAPSTFRASWAVCEAKPSQEEQKGGTRVKMSTEAVIAMRTQSPRAERLKSGSTSLPAPVTVVSKPQRKGKSRTLDNSDLNCLSEDLLKGKSGQMTSDIRTGQLQGTSTRDRKMLRFISGIFTKSTQGPSSAGMVPQVPSSSQRESSEDEGRKAPTPHPFMISALANLSNYVHAKTQHCVCLWHTSKERTLWLSILPQDSRAFPCLWYRDKSWLWAGPKKKCMKVILSRCLCIIIHRTIYEFAALCSSRSSEFMEQQQSFV